MSLLALEPGRGRYELVQGVGGEASVPPEKGVIGVSTRSLIGVFFYLSHGIDVPAAHREEGLVTSTRDAAGGDFDWRQLTGDVFRVRTCRNRPAAAAIAVPYRGHWFYIEAADLETKSTFALLLELFNMSAEASFGAGPTLTLPVGR